MILDFYYLMLIIVDRINDEMLLILDLIFHYLFELVEVVDHLNEILFEYLQNEFSMKKNKTKKEDDS